MSDEAGPPARAIRFSIVVPAYNVERHIARCLRSLVRQSYRAHEILVFDDGSTDGTAELVERFAAREPSVRLIRQSNTGQGVIRNRGIAEASGDYLLFVDSDDDIDRRTLERCAAAIERGARPDFVTFRFQPRYPAGIRGSESDWVPQILGREELLGDETELLLENRWLAPWQSAYRLDFLRGHGLRNGEGYLFEDQEFTAGAIIAAERVALVDAPLYHYHFNARSSLREKSDVARRRRIDGRRASRHAILVAVERYHGTMTARGVLADHDVHDFVQEVALGVYTEAEREEVIGDIAMFLGGLAPVDPAVLVRPLAAWYARPEATRDAVSLTRTLGDIAAAERNRVERTMAFRLARPFVPAPASGSVSDDGLVDMDFAVVYRSFPHRMLRRVGTATAPMIRRFRRTV